MKQVLFYLFFFSSLFLYAQVPDMPEFCLVTVGNDSLVHLKWNYSDTTKINGFIVKRKIFGGIGVVDGTLNNIEILPNTIFSAKDTSNSYSTFSNPYERSEEYAINVFLIRNDSTIFSNLTHSLRTVFLRTKWDKCAQKAFFSWNRYINRNVQKYRLLVSTDNNNYTLLREFVPSDTSFSSVALMKNTKYYFKIQAILSPQGNCLADTSVSNISDIFTYSPISPTKLTALYASVSDNNHIETAYEMKGGFGIYKVILLRNSNSQIAQFDGQITDNVFIDSLNVVKNNCYKFQAIDSCANVLKESNKVCNIFLHIVQNNNSFDLSFTPTSIDNKKPDNYLVLVDIGKNWQEIKQIPNNINALKVSMSEIFTGLNYGDLSQIGFKIEAVRNNIESFSNEVYLPLKPVIAVPNAFSPMSNQEQDRYFTIKAMFIKKIDLMIFTENNELIFHSTDLKNRWNGKLNNSVFASSGAYIYFIKYQGNNGIWYKKTGVINLITQY